MKADADFLHIENSCTITRESHFKFLVQQLEEAQNTMKIYVEDKSGQCGKNPSRFCYTYITRNGALMMH